MAPVRKGNKGRVVFLEDGPDYDSESETENTCRMPQKAPRERKSQQIVEEEEEDKEEEDKEEEDKEEEEEEEDKEEEDKEEEVVEDEEEVVAVSSGKKRSAEHFAEANMAKRAKLSRTVVTPVVAPVVVAPVEQPEETDDLVQQVLGKPKQRLTADRLVKGDVKEVPKHLNDMALAMFHAVKVCREFPTAPFESVCKELGLHLDNQQLTITLHSLVNGEASDKPSITEFRKELQAKFDDAMAPFAPHRKQKQAKAKKAKLPDCKSLSNKELLTEVKRLTEELGHRGLNPSDTGNSVSEDADE